VTIDQSPDESRTRQYVASDVEGAGNDHDCSVQSEDTVPSVLVARTDENASSAPVSSVTVADDAPAPHARTLVVTVAESAETEAISIFAAGSPDQEA
jgi:hypothetical protein